MFEPVYSDKEAFLQVSSSLCVLYTDLTVVLLSYSQEILWYSVTPGIPFGSILLAGDLLSVRCVLTPSSQSRYSSWDLDP